MAYNHLPYSIWTVRFIDLLRYWIAFLILPTGYISTHFFTKKSCLTIWFVSSASLQLNLPLNLWKYADNTIFRLFLMWKNKSKRDHQGGYLKVFIRPSSPPFLVLSCNNASDFGFLESCISVHRLCTGPVFTTLAHSSLLLPWSFWSLWHWFERDGGLLRACEIVRVKFQLYTFF